MYRRTPSDDQRKAKLLYLAMCEFRNNPFTLSQGQFLPYWKKSAEKKTSFYNLVANTENLCYVTAIFARLMVCGIESLEFS